MPPVTNSTVATSTVTMTTAPDSAAALRRAFVVTAHPDGVDFGCAGTGAARTAAGVEVTHCIRTHHSRTARLPDLEGVIRQHPEGNAKRYDPEPDRLAEVFHVVDTA